MPAFSEATRTSATNRRWGSTGLVQVLTIGTSGGSTTRERTRAEPVPDPAPRRASSFLAGRSSGAAFQRHVRLQRPKEIQHVLLLLLAKRVEQTDHAVGLGTLAGMLSDRSQ